MIAGVLMMGASPAMSASFDCAKASHPLEHIICDNPELSKLDDAMAKAYNNKMDILFDKNAFRSQQSAWQKSLRAQCNETCLAQDLAVAYTRQISFVEAVNSESFSANYKTADISDIEIFHIDKEQFDIRISRGNVDEPDAEPICLFPADDSEAGAVAKMTSSSEAAWSNGSCTLDFKFMRDQKDSVVSFDMNGSEGCQSYCRDKRYRLGDSNFIPENDWAAGAQ